MIVPSDKVFNGIDAGGRQNASACPRLGTHNRTIHSSLRCGSQQLGHEQKSLKYSLKFMLVVSTYQYGYHLKK